MNHVGIPGIGGSLGQCQVCGQNFMMEIIMSQKVASFMMDNFPDQMLYANHKCVGLVKAGMDYESLPDGPIKTTLSIAKEAE